MYISTRELLGQTADRRTCEAIIERYCGTSTAVEMLLNEPSVGPVLRKMGTRALSSEALQAIAQILSKRQGESGLRMIPAQPDQAS